MSSVSASALEPPPDIGLGLWNSVRVFFFSFQITRTSWAAKGRLRIEGSARSWGHFFPITLFLWASGAGRGFWRVILLEVCHSSHKTWIGLSTFFFLPHQPLQKKNRHKQRKRITASTGARAVHFRNPTFECVCCCRQLTYVV